MYMKNLGVTARFTVMRKSIIYILLLLPMTYYLTNAYQEERSVLDRYVPLLRRIKSIMFNSLHSKLSSRTNARFLRANRKIQDMPPDTAFPCNLNMTLRSKNVPNSAHKLRPGDIDVVGAIGDSLTAGFGVAATNAVEVLYEGRGVVFSVGGQGNWNSFLTLPNILKNYNPNIYGYSLNSISIDRNSKFNVAEGGAISQNMPYMAKVLVTRIKNDKNVNLAKDWKMITIFIGHNDFCSVDCYEKDFNKILSDHERDLLEVLRIFRKNLPRTVVNLIPPIHLNILLSLTDKTEFCGLSHLVACPCIIGLPNLHLRSKMMNLMTKWQELDIKIANYPEFDKDDFAVLMHLFTLNYTFPHLKEGGIDYGYLAPDCFHASQRGHAKLANDLWNSLLEPYSKKSVNSQLEFERFNCPSEKYPYIFTKRNSRNIR